eukprot:c19490_g1_i1.p1 GENE.c19490_g1_i1~~c19490_g1_i1.p1  ORF type:complete len:393 (+),score=76.64 c19490_g1_i1:185-1363(+)
MSVQLWVLHEIVNKAIVDGPNQVIQCPMDQLFRVLFARLHGLIEAHNTCVMNAQSEGSNSVTWCMAISEANLCIQTELRNRMAKQQLYDAPAQTTPSASIIGSSTRAKSPQNPPNSFGGQPRRSSHKEWRVPRTEQAPQQNKSRTEQPPRDRYSAQTTSSSTFKIHSKSEPGTRPQPLSSHRSSPTSDESPTTFQGRFDYFKDMVVRYLDVDDPNEKPKPLRVTAAQMTPEEKSHVMDLAKTHGLFARTIATRKEVWLTKRGQSTQDDSQGNNPIGELFARLGIEPDSGEGRGAVKVYPNRKDGLVLSTVQVGSHGSQPLFTCRVTYDNKELGKASAGSQEQAKALAAKHALRTLDRQQEVEEREREISNMWFERATQRRGGGRGGASSQQS